MFIKLLLLSVGFIAVAMFGFALNIIFKKDGRFPETRVGHNKKLRKKKVFCIKVEQKIIDKKIKTQKYQKLNCNSCK